MKDNATGAGNSAEQQLRELLTRRTRLRVALGELGRAFYYENRRLERQLDELRHPRQETEKRVNVASGVFGRPSPALEQLVRATLAAVDEFKSDDAAVVAKGSHRIRPADAKLAGVYDALCATLEGLKRNFDLDVCTEEVCATLDRRGLPIDMGKVRRALKSTGVGEKTPRKKTWITEDGAQAIATKILRTLGQRARPIAEAKRVISPGNNLARVSPQSLSHDLRLTAFGFDARRADIVRFLDQCLGGRGTKLASKTLSPTTARRTKS